MGAPGGHQRSESGAESKISASLARVAESFLREAQDVEKNVLRGFADCGSRRSIAEIIVESMKEIPPEVMATMPKDGASQHDRYIYGWPKRDV